MLRATIFNAMRRRREETEGRARREKMLAMFKGMAGGAQEIPPMPQVQRVEVPVGTSPRDAVRQSLIAAGFDVSDMPPACDDPECNFCAPIKEGGFPAGYSSDENKGSVH